MTKEQQYVDSVVNRLMGDPIAILQAHWRENPYKREMYVGRQLYEAYESKLRPIERYHAYNTMSGIYNGGLMFKGVVLYIDGEGWHCRCQ